MRKIPQSNPARTCQHLHYFIINMECTLPQTKLIQCLKTAINKQSNNPLRNNKKDGVQAEQTSNGCFWLPKRKSAKQHFSQCPGNSASHKHPTIFSQKPYHVNRAKAAKTKARQ